VVTTNERRGRLSAELANALSRLASRGKSIFTAGDLAKALGKPARQVWRTLSFLVDRGWAIRLMKGVYLIVPLEAGPKSVWSEDSLVIAGCLAKLGAVAYWTACHYWNWTEQVPRTVFVQTPQRVRTTARTVIGVPYRFVHVQPKKFFGTVRRTAGQGHFTITDREKTLVDALDHPELCGGIAQVVEMLPAAAQAVNWDRVDEHLKRLGSGAAYKRMGLLVEHLGEEVHIPGGAKRIERWRLLLTGGYAPLEPHRPMTGTINARWRVRLNVPGIPREGRR